MCGIFGYVGPRTDGATIVLEGLKQLEYRGYDSWGVAVMPTGASNKIVVKKKTGKIGEANVKDMPSSSFAFGHTRWATHGGVSEVNAHPHLDCTGSIAIIHNGILENYEALKQKLLKKGHRFISQTDTEVAVHLIEEYAKSMLFSKAVQKAFNDMEGLNAFIAMNKNNHQFVAVRSGSPLVVGFGDGENFLASDAAAMLPYTRQVHFLEDDEMALVSAKGVMMFNARTGARIKPQKQTLTWSVSEVEKGAYPFFMLKEIHEQPGVMADIAADNAEHAVKLAGIIKQSYGTYMVGCGT
ncbi:MAG: class II glutamine amidotransferase, partial [Patescibacteria group bacterium]